MCIKPAVLIDLAAQKEEIQVLTAALLVILGVGIDL